MKILKILPALIFSAFLFSCEEFGNIQDIVDSTSDKVEDLSLEEDFETVTINSDYSLMLPNYLRSTNILNDEASLQYQNIIKGVYVIVVDESKQEFIDAFKLYEMYDDSLTVAENLRDAQLQNMTQVLLDSEKVNERSLSIRGNDIELMEISGIIEESGIALELTYTLAFIEGKESIYTVYFWCKTSKAEKYRNTFEKSISTFRELR